MEGSAVSSVGSLEVEEMMDATEELRNSAVEEKRVMYSKLRTERERTTFAVMMKMTSEALNNVRKEFFMRDDSVDLHEFVYIIQKHLSGRGPTDERFEFASKEKQEFALNVYELFNEIDVNGDGGCEWMEFTQFVVDKASFLNKKLKITTVPMYYETTPMLDSSSQIRHRHEMTKMVDMSILGHVAIAEEMQNRIFILDARTGGYIENHKGDIRTEASPISMAFVEEPTPVLVASLANMTIATYSVDDPNVVRNYSTLSTWATPGVQMALTYIPKTKLLYSGATNYNIYVWDIKERKIKETLSGHTDIVMSLVTLSKLNYVASGSFDKTVSIWDAYTSQQLLKLYGHKKGIVGMDYAPDYRLLVTAGFEHDACMWSPFVSSCVFRLKGHHAPLVGCQTVRDSPEIITADQSGIIKIWDIRNFQCIQSFAANISGRGAKVKDGSKLGAFVRCDVPVKTAYGGRPQNDARIYVASKLICSYDSKKEVTSPTTDMYSVLWCDWVGGSLTIVTVSERNVIIWDTILGSKKNVLSNICGKEITACCLDDRQRKIIIGDVSGAIGVYNPSSGVLMKGCPASTGVQDMVIALRYVDNPRHFFAGFQNGTIRLYDESGLDQCRLILSFDRTHYHRELLHAIYNDHDETFTTVGHAEGSFKMWDSKSGKCEAKFEICGPYDHVVQIEYLFPYSSIAVSDSIGNVAIFSYTKGAKWVEKRISGFHNQTPTRAEPEEMPIKRDEDEEQRPSRALFNIDPEDDVLSVTSSQADAERKKFHAGMNNLNNTLNKSTHGKSGGTSLTNSIHGGSRDPKNMAESQKSVVPFASRRRDTNFSSLGENDEDESEDGEGEFQDTEDMIDALNFLERKATEDAVKKDIKESEKKWGKVTPAQAFAWDKEHFVLYTGDTMGNLRSFCMKDVVQDASMRRASYLPTAFSKVKKSHPRSAMPPFPQKDVLYAMGMKADASAYLGVKFLWAVEAHEACMLYIRVAPTSVITTATDCLVRMWSHEGIYMGVLIESIPEGIKSSQWLFEADVQAAIDNEAELVTELVVKVKDLLNDTEKPELEAFDFYGLNKGEVAPEFTQSELRKRITETSSILGVTFNYTEEKGTKMTPADFDEESFRSLSQGSTGRLEKVQQLQPFATAPTSPTSLPGEGGLNGGPSTSTQNTMRSNLNTGGYMSKGDLLSHNTAPATKSYNAALTELRSSDPAASIEQKSKGLTEIELRRKAAQIEEMALIYEKKAGILIGHFYHEGSANTEVSRQLDGEGVQYLAGRSTGKKGGTGQRQIKSGMVYKVENEHDIGISQLLAHDMSMTERKEREKTANDDLYCLHPPAMTGRFGNNGGVNSQANSQLNTHRLTGRSNVSGAMDHGGSLTAHTNKKKISSAQAAKIAFAGQRNQEHTLQRTEVTNTHKKITKLTDEEREKLEKQREERVLRALQSRRRSSSFGRRGTRQIAPLNASGKSGSGSPTPNMSRSPSVREKKGSMSRDSSNVDLAGAGAAMSEMSDKNGTSPSSLNNNQDQSYGGLESANGDVGGIGTNSSKAYGQGLSNDTEGGLYGGSGLGEDNGEDGEREGGNNGGGSTAVGVVSFREDDGGS